MVFASPLYFWTISSKMKAFIERFYCIAEEDENPPFGRYERYPVRDCAFLMTAADNYFWTFEQAASYYQFTLVNYIGFVACRRLWRYEWETGDYKDESLTECISFWESNL